MLRLEYYASAYDGLASGVDMMVILIVGCTLKKQAELAIKTSAIQEKTLSLSSRMFINVTLTP